MGLVGYSDSDASSDDEVKPKVAVKLSKAKPTIQKVVDSSNPHKIRVNLPETTQTEINSGESKDEPPAKRAKLGGGLGGFNAMLPAPKKPASASAGGGGFRGLGKGVSLKTGAAPGFSREPMPIEDAEEYRQDPEGEDGIKINQVPQEPLQHEVKEPVKKGNPMMFKPLSVARNPKKKKVNAAPSASTTDKVETSSDQPPPSKPKTPKVSLFSMGATEEHDRATTNSATTGEYMPIVYRTETESGVEMEGEESQIPPDQSKQNPTSASGAQSLDAIAADLNLSKSARRQLFGRGGPTGSAVNVTNFNTDQEWEHNEELRKAGEQVQHNPVRAIAGGKHSLKQLVSNASAQKDALEESFAKGKANKREAGNKYGW